jgi:hypothetical protein
VADWGGASGVMVSEDGLACAGPISMNAGGTIMHRVAYGNGLFVAVGNGGTTADGLAWARSSIQPAAGAILRCITFGNGVFVAADDMAPNHWHLSRDGLIWVRIG